LFVIFVTTGEKMLAKTVRLFIKALIFGLLINLGLQQFGAVNPPVLPTAVKSQLPGQTIPLKADIHLINSTGD
jgi:hypothetical protein